MKCMRYEFMVSSIHLLEGEVVGGHCEGDGAEGLEGAELPLNDGVRPEGEGPVTVGVEAVVAREIGEEGHLEALVALRLDALQHDARVLLLGCVLADHEVGGGGTGRGAVEREVDRDALLRLAVLVLDLDGEAGEEGLLLGLEELLLDGERGVGQLLLVLLVTRADHDAVRLDLFVGVELVSELGVEVDDLVLLLDSVVEEVDGVRGVEEALDGVLVDEQRLGVGLLVVLGEEQQQAGQLLVEGAQHQPALLAHRHHLHLRLPLQLEHVQQSLQDALHAPVHLLLVAALLLQHQLEVAVRGDELEQAEAEVVGEGEGQHVARGHVDLLLGEGLVVGLHDLLADGVDAHLEVVLLGVGVEELIAEVERGLRDGAVQDEHLLVLHELLQQLQVHALLVEQLRVHLVLPRVRRPLHVLVQALYVRPRNQLLPLHLARLLRRLLVEVVDVLVRLVLLRRRLALRPARDLLQIVVDQLVIVELAVVDAAGLLRLRLLHRVLLGLLLLARTLLLLALPPLLQLALLLLLQPLLFLLQSVLLEPLPLLLFPPLLLLPLSLLALELVLFLTLFAVLALPLFLFLELPHLPLSFLFLLALSLLLLLPLLLFPLQLLLPLSFLFLSALPLFFLSAFPFLFFSAFPLLALLALFLLFFSAFPLLPVFLLLLVLELLSLLLLLTQLLFLLAGEPVLLGLALPVLALLLQPRALLLLAALLGLALLPLGLAAVALLGLLGLALALLLLQLELLLLLPALLGLALLFLPLLPLPFRSLLLALAVLGLALLLLAAFPLTAQALFLLALLFGLALLLLALELLLLASAVLLAPQPLLLLLLAAVLELALPAALLLLLLLEDPALLFLPPALFLLPLPFLALLLLLPLPGLLLALHPLLLVLLRELLLALAAQLLVLPRLLLALPLQLGLALQLGPLVLLPPPPLLLLALLARLLQPLLVLPPLLLQPRPLGLPPVALLLRALLQLAAALGLPALAVLREAAGGLDFGLGDDAVEGGLEEVELGGEDVGERGGCALGRVAVDQVCDPEFDCAAEVSHVVPAVADDSLLEGENLFEEGGDVLQELLEVGEVEDVLEPAHLHLVLLAEAAAHNVKEVGRVLERRELPLQRLRLARHLARLLLALALAHLPQLAGERVAQLAAHAHALLANDRLHQQLQIRLHATLPLAHRLPHLPLQQLALPRERPAPLLHRLLQLRQEGRLQRQQARDLARLLVLAHRPQHLLLAQPQLAGHRHGVALQEVVELQQHVQPHRHLLLALALHRSAREVLLPEQRLHALEPAAELTAQELEVDCGEALLEVGGVCTMGEEGELLEVLLGLVGGLEDEGVEEVGVLRALEDGGGEVGEEGVEGALHAAHQLHLPRQLLPQEALDRVAPRQRPLRQQLRVLRENGPEGLVAHLRTHKFKLYATNP